MVELLLVKILPEKLILFHDCPKFGVLKKFQVVKGVRIACSHKYSFKRLQTSHLLNKASIIFLFPIHQIIEKVDKCLLL